MLRLRNNAINVMVWIPPRTYVARRHAGGHLSEPDTKISVRIENLTINEIYKRGMSFRKVGKT